MTMTPRQRNRLLTTSAAATALAALLVLLIGMSLPVTLPAPPPAPAAPAADAGSAIDAAGSAAPDRRVDPQALRRLCARPLRRPLVDPPATRAAAVPRRPMTLRLVGLIREAGHSMAMFQRPDGSIELAAVNARLSDVGGEVVVKAIEADAVTVRYAGGERVLELPRDLAGEASP